jgi:quinoprotein glucose dehydrogenase
LYRAFDPAAHDSTLARETKRLLAEGFDQRSDDELFKLLGQADQRVRQEAQFALVRKGAAAQARLEQTARSAPSSLARIHAIWGLGMLLRERGARGSEKLVALLSDRDEEIRAQAARVLGDLRAPTVGPALAELLKDPAPRVRMYAAIGLARIRFAGASSALIAFAASTPADETVLRHCASMAMGSCMKPAELSGLSTHASVAVRLAAVVALRRVESGEVQRFLADSEAAIVLEAARAIYDAPIPAGMEALAALTVREGDEYALQRRALNANFRLGTRAHAERLVNFAERADVSVKLRREALLRLGQWAKPSSRDSVVGAWRPLSAREAAFIGELLLSLASTPALSHEPDLAEQWIQACTENEVTTAMPTLVAWIKDEALPGAVLASAIRGLVSLLDSPELPPELRALAGELVSAMIASSDHEMRAAAMAELPRVAPSEALELALAFLRDGEVRERRAALRALGRIDSPDAVAALGVQIDRQIAGLFPPELALDLALAAEKHDSSKLARKLGTLRAPRSAEPVLAEYVDALYGGDAKRGRKLFREKSELACLRCHLIEEAEGGEVGPDLRGLGSRTTRADLLEALCEPNRAIAQGFRNTILFLEDDRHVEGRVMSQDATKIVLIDAQAKVHEIELSEIAERREGQSAMPADLIQHISREEMRDLIEYLSRL